MKTYALPQFSRNYGSRGGAYEKPTTVVDNSASAWAQAIANIGRITADSITQRSANNAPIIKQTQKYLDDNAKFVMQNYNEFSDNVQNVGLNNPSLNRAGVFAINKKAEAYMNMRRAQTQEQQAQYSRDYAFWDGKVNELVQMVQAGKSADDTYADDYISNYANVNMPNGIASGGQDEGLSRQYQLAMPTRLGTTKNPKEQWFFDESDNWKLKTMYTSDQITKAYEDGEIANNYIVADPQVLFSFDAGKIDDLTSSRNKFLIDSGIIDKNTKKYTPDYVGKVTGKLTDDGKYQYQFRPVDIGAVTGTASVWMASQARTYAKYPQQAQNLWNTLLGEGKFIPEDEIKIIEQKYGELPRNEQGGYKLIMSDGETGSAFNAASIELLTQGIGQFLVQDLRPGNDSNYTLAPKGDDDDKKVDVSYIDKLKIEAPGVGPVEEGSDNLFDLSEVELQISPYGFNVVSQPLLVGGRQGRVLTKSVGGADRKVTVFENLTEKKLKNLMKFLDTGDNSYLTQDIDAQPDTTSRYDTSRFNPGNIVGVSN